MAGFRQGSDKAAQELQVPREEVEWMDLLTVGPRIYSFESLAAFADGFGVGEGDLVITNRYITGGYFDECGAEMIYQEEYGTGEPTDAMADAMLAAVKMPFTRVIAIGGGTVIDIAKVFALQSPSPVEELFLHLRPAQKEKTLVILPTTCGTGSEMTNISVMQSVGRSTKMALTSDDIYADAAVLVPALLKSLPYKVFATSSLDALVHAIESSLSPGATPFSLLFGREAIRLILTGYKAIRDEGPTAWETRMEDFLRASCYAGIAFGNAGCAGVHAMSYPLGVNHHVPHGEANYTMLAGVLARYEAKAPDGQLEGFKASLAGVMDCCAADAFTELDSLLFDVLPRKRLRDYGVQEDELPAFTKNVMTAQTRLLANNYVPFDASDVLEIYKALY